MTPDEIDQAYAEMAKDPDFRHVNWRKRARDAEAEVVRLNAELTEARLATEEAWDAYDNVLEEKRSR